MKRECLNIFLISILFVIFAIVYIGKCGNILIDFSREAYIPYQMLFHKILIKDIFLIYGFFGYFFNFLIYKFLGVNINYLTFEAHLIAYLMLVLYYFISRCFLNRKESVLLAFSFLSINIFSLSTFNFVMPYSYSTLWGYFGSYLLLFCFLKHKFKLSFLCLGFIFINKLELAIILSILVFIYMFKNKLFLKRNIFYILCFPVLNFIYILFYKINLKDIINNLNYLNIMVHTKTINIFYKNMGVYFNKAYFLLAVKFILLFIVVSLISYLLYRNNKKIFSYLFFAVMFLSLKLYYFVFLSSILILYPLFIKLNKNKNISKKILFLLLFAIVLCLKSIINLSYYNYSNFGFPIFVLLIYVLYKPILNKKWLFNIAFIIILIINYLNFKYIYNFPKVVYKTDIGKIYIYRNNYNSFDKLYKYLENNLNKDDTFVVLPEGQFFNLIFKKQYPFYYSTLTPLDFETFGDKKIIDDFNKNKPNYIIFYPRNTEEYGASSICHDYGKKLCTNILNSYDIVDIIKGKFDIIIFKRK